MSGFISKQLVVFLVIVVISAFTHLWNPIGFPYFNVDEGIYLGRAIYFINTHIPKDPYIGYDHPYFGHIFLAALLSLTNYSGLIDAHPYLHYDILIFYPRIIMGLLALLDTFLLFKLVELRYNTNAALIAALIFAVMPITWITRWVLLDVIQLPFILLSLLLAVKASTLKSNSVTSHRIMFFIPFLSGVFLGLAIFTKIPAVALIPVLSYLVSRHNTKRLSIIVVMLLPTIIIPSLWLIHAASVDQFESWWRGVNGQLSREDENRPLYSALSHFFGLDPLMIFFGIMGITYATIKRDVFILLSIVPYFIFMYFVGYVVVFHLLFFVIIICISFGKFLADTVQFAKRKKYLYRVSIVGVAGILIVGFYSTADKITVDENVNSFKAAAFLGEYLDSNLKNNQSIQKSNGIGILGNPFFFWVEKYTFHNNGYYPNVKKFDDSLIISIMDRLPREIMAQNNYMGKALKKIFSTFQTIKLFSIPNNPDDNNPTDDSIDIYLTNFSKYDKEKLNATNLLDRNFEWKNAKYTNVERSNGEIKLIMNTNEANRKDNLNRVILNNSIRLNETVSFLLTRYFYPHPTGASFTLELNDAQTNTRLWSQLLKNLERENGSTLFFILPENIKGKKITADIRIHTTERGVDAIVLKNLTIYN